MRRLPGYLHNRRKIAPFYYEPFSSLIVRRELTVNYDLPLRDDYRQYILKLLADAVKNG